MLCFRCIFIGSLRACHCQGPPFVLPSSPDPPLQLQDQIKNQKHIADDQNDRQRLFPAKACFLICFLSGMIPMLRGRCAVIGGCGTAFLLGSIHPVGRLSCRRLVGIRFHIHAGNHLHRQPADTGPINLCPRMSIFRGQRDLTLAVFRHGLCRRRIQMIPFHIPRRITGLPIGQDRRRSEGRRIPLLCLRQKPADIIASVGKCLRSFRVDGGFPQRLPDPGGQLVKIFILIRSVGEKGLVDHILQSRRYGLISSFRKGMVHRFCIQIVRLCFCNRITQPLCLTDTVRQRIAAHHLKAIGGCSKQSFGKDLPVLFLRSRPAAP